ncbi:MAG TPA: sugar transferase [Planctomycetaceae bacterium]|nr:sugar transferase [Planctomycetaceae bacterium]
MFQNIGRIASSDAAAKADVPPSTIGMSPRAIEAFERAVRQSPDVVGRIPDRAASPRPHSPPPPKPAGEAHLLQASDQSGLPYLWQNNVPVVPQSTSIRFWSLRLKRAMDVFMALASVIIFAPILIIAALAVKLTSNGPVFFKQERTGLQNRPFSVYKFRTMYVDRQDLTGVQQTTEEDPRITPIGRVLRRTSVDEVPQIINILKGEMSFVGPRPHVAGMLAGGLPYEELVPYYDVRHAMKPGLTGWAQANGFRGPTTDPIRARQRVDHDIAYVQNFSIWLDVVIIAKTAWREFVTGTGV